MPEKVDIHIESLVRKELVIHGENKMLKFCRKQLKMDPNFDLVLVTSLGKPYFNVNVTNHVSIINFYVTHEGILQNLLAMIVENERADLM